MRTMSKKENTNKKEIETLEPTGKEGETPSMEPTVEPKPEGEPTKEGEKIEETSGKKVLNPNDCPFCGTPDAPIIKEWSFRGLIAKRHQCKNESCGKKFNTYYDKEGKYRYTVKN